MELDVLEAQIDTQTQVLTIGCGINNTNVAYCPTVSILDLLLTTYLPAQRLIVGELNTRNALLITIG